MEFSMREFQCDICIIGAGASGMTAAIQAKRANRQAEVLVLEKNEIPGRKIRATGNGRCNLTNTKAREYLKTLRFFSDIGLAIREYPNGLVYPYSESAADVADLLASRMKDLGVKLLTSTEVTSVKISEEEGSGEDTERSAGRTKVIEAVSQEFGNIQVSAPELIISAGGKAGPAFGTKGDGAKLAASLGHNIIKQVPVLTAIEVVEDDIDQLSGIRARGSVILYKKGRRVFEEPGEVQFTRTGLSGICVFNMTRHMLFEDGESMADFGIGINLCSDFDIDDYIEAVAFHSKDLHSGQKAVDMLRSLLKPNLARYVIGRSGVDPGKNISALSKAERNAIIAAVTDLRFKPKKLKGWKDAQCTAGGVDRFQVDDETCQSLLIPGLYFTGEVLDYDGPCGGYNLNFAWLTGMAAGESAGRALVDSEE